MSGWALGLYGLATRMAEPLLRRKLARRSRLEPGYAEAVDERFGRYSQPAEASADLVWLHAVSLGETRAASVLLKALRSRHPGLRLLLTHGTATGRAEGRALLQAGDVQVWQPWDSPEAVARFFSHFRPRLGLLMETEVWPCTMRAARKASVPVVLVNARLSARSLGQALRLPRLARPAYGALSAVYAQTGDDAQRFARLGVAADVVGNLKFDAALPAGQVAQGRAWRLALHQAVLLFASSREGEESGFFKQISAAHQSIQGVSATNRVADITSPAHRRDHAVRVGAAAGGQAGGSPHPVHYLVVPRHPQRFAEVESLALAQGLTVCRKSSWPADGPAASAEAQAADVWLGDTLGDMALYYSLADVALLGGSFEPLGGQNLIEAAACACPVVMGPHTFNFTDAAAAAEVVGAAQRASNLQEGMKAALRLTEDRQSQASAAQAGLAFAAANRGATERTVDALERFLIR
ncbi:MAG: Three-deoxy-D-manno-octulosonic-acid transferase-like protein [Polaromonas sp.]|nr:Three-deoxy-D-manno-octulosonic-acid transferase-like protein [Polaromonas sp.]